MVEVVTALGWRRTVKRTQTGDLSAQEILDHMELINGSTILEGMTKRALVAMALVLTEDGWERLGDRSKLGRPTGKAAQREDGAFERSFENGIAIFVPGFQNNVLVEFDEPMIPASVSEIATTNKAVILSPGGEMFLKPTEDSGTLPPS